MCSLILIQNSVWEGLQCSTPTYLGLLLCALADQYGIVVLHKGGGRRDHAHSAVLHARSPIKSSSFGRRSVTHNQCSHGNDDT